jgi:hypothetical protein
MVQDTYNRAIDLGLRTNKHAQYEKMITNRWCLIEISNMANCFLVFKYYLLTRVNWPVIKRLSAQGRLDSNGGLHYFWCPNKTWTLPLGASDSLTIVKKELKMKKLQPLKVQRVKNQKKTNHQTLQRLIPNTQNILYMLLLDFHFDL